MAAAGLTWRLFAAIWLQFWQVLRVNTSRCALQAKQIPASRTMVSGHSIVALRSILCGFSKGSGFVMLMLNLITCEARCASGQALFVLSQPTKLKTQLAHEKHCIYKCGSLCYTSLQCEPANPPWLYAGAARIAEGLPGSCAGACLPPAPQPAKLQWQDACRPRLLLAARLQRLLLSSCAMTSRNTSGVRTSIITTS